MTYKVLLVDDDDDNRFMFVQMVRELDCTVDEAASGQQAETMAHANIPDLVLLDVMMPIQNGYETCRNLRRSG